ncbi:MAG: D-glycero-alpha-D-manno-heptose-1,7-bisphosphate 7-phosphatase [Polyangiales bacterium]
MGSRPALFLDRDGVINVEVHRLHRPEDVVVIPGVKETIETANGWNVPVVVITNQAGIGHGFYDESDLRATNERICELIAPARIDAFHHCPHTPRDACRCRKPLPGMLLDAAREMDLDLTRSVFVGDKDSDLEAGRAAGCRAFLVRTGYGHSVSEGFDAVGESLVELLPAIAELLSPR